MAVAVPRSVARQSLEVRIGELFRERRTSGTLCIADTQVPDHLSRIDSEIVFVMGLVR